MKCSSCGTELNAGGLFSGSYSALSTEELKAVNDYLNLSKDAGCTKCLRKEASKTASIISQRISTLSSQFFKEDSWIPITTSGISANWDFETIDIVSAQANVGTGVFAELSSDFSDLFGTQSDTYNQKMAKAENICKAALTSKALNLGADAVIGVDIDYSEVGGGKGILMVCMTGTAVHLNQLSVLSISSQERLKHTKAMFKEIEQLRTLDARFRKSFSPPTNDFLK